MKLLLEKINDVSFDSSGEDRRMYIEGIFMMGDWENENGRKYPIDILEKACEVYTREKIEQGKSVGELNHPDTPNINYERAAIRTISLRREGTNIIGKALVLKTGFGPLIQGLIEDQVTVAVSSRGLASVDKVNGIEIVQDDFMICAAADVVSDPSAKDAWMNHVMESKEWMIENGLIVPKVFEEAKKIIDKAQGRKSIDEAVNKVSALFSRVISSR